MPSSFGVDIELNIPERPFQTPQRFLQDVAYHTRGEIIRRLRTGRDVRGQFMRKLKPKTVLDKIRERSPTPSVPLMRTGLMMRSIKFRRKRKDLFEIYIASVGTPRRDLLGVIHQYTGANPKARVIRPFFGMTYADRKWAILRFRRWVIESLAKARMKRTVIK